MSDSQSRTQSLIIENGPHLRRYGKRNVRSLWHTLLSPFIYLAVQCDKLIYPSGM